MFVILIIASVRLDCCETIVRVKLTRLVQMGSDLFILTYFDLLLMMLSNEVLVWFGQELSNSTCLVQFVYLSHPIGSL